MAPTYVPRSFLLYLVACLATLLLVATFQVYRLLISVMQYGVSHYLHPATKRHACLDHDEFLLDAASLQRPPLAELIENYNNNSDAIENEVDNSWSSANIIGKVQFLLDFAIIGHPKTATTTLLVWLSSHPEIAMHSKENRAFQRTGSLSGGTAALVQSLYQDLPADPHLLRGYKAPRDIHNVHALTALALYFPQTKLIVGLRHPILWFESFYKFRLRYNVTMPPANSLIGPCYLRHNGVCTEESQFHVHLSYLGKTNATSNPIEQALVGYGRDSAMSTSQFPSRLPNPVFLYEIAQLHDHSETRAGLFRADLQDFLGLSTELSPIIREAESPPPEQQPAFDICIPEYNELRAVLLKYAQDASIWIRVFFLRSSDVRVSSPEHFKVLLANWMKDPCTERLEGVSHRLTL